MDAERHDEHLYIPRSGVMFSRGTMNRSELATDLAMGIVAEGGWAALTLRNVATRTGPGTAHEHLALSSLVDALVPQSWLEEVFDGVWLSVVEAGRWDHTIGLTVADVQERESELIRELVGGSRHDAGLVLALLRGRRATPRWR